MQVIKLIKKEKRIMMPNSIIEDMKIPECIRLPKVKIIKRITTENNCTKTFFFEYPEIARIAYPGQFVMLGVYHELMEDVREEIPLSLSYIDVEQGMIGVTVKRAGETTRALFKHNVGKDVSIRGPYGKGFIIKGSTVAVVGGGIGIAPLALLVEKLVENHTEVSIFLGAKTSSELLFVDRIRETGAKLVLATEDGSAGEEGTITDVFAKALRHFTYDHIYTCGRELMMKNILELSLKYNIPAQFNLERLIKCGRGVCGHCAIDGYRVCTDGAVFPSEIVKTLKDFGKRQLDESGAITKLTF